MSWRKDEVGYDRDGDGLNASRRVPSPHAGALSLLGLGCSKQLRHSIIASYKSTDSNRKNYCNSVNTLVESLKIRIHT